MENKYELNSNLVNAVYSGRNKNLLIDALPRPFTDYSDIDKHYTKNIEFHRNTALKMGNIEKMLDISNLKFLRLPLPFQKDIEQKFYLSLCESYMNRELGKFNGVYKLKGSVAACSNEGFAMLGYSGCGKSSTLNIMLSRYPKVIKHTIDGEVFYQIPYLVVSCVPNSNFGVLYQSIGKAVDDILDTDVYEELLYRAKYLGDKMQAIENIIEKFAIGAIIFDEIQNIDFAQNRENSYEGLLTISNDTKVAICVVGTEDAYGKMFINLRNARRAGHLIPASSYCGNKLVYESLLNTIFGYQWTKKKVELTDELLDAFYSSTRGIIALTITLYQAVQEVCITNEVDMDDELVRMVAKEYFKHLEEVTCDLNDPHAQKIIEKVDKESRKIIAKILKEAKDNEQRYIREHQDSALNKLIGEIHNFLPDYSPTDIKTTLIGLSDKYTGDKLKSEAIKSLTKITKKKTIDSNALKLALSSSYK